MIDKWLEKTMESGHDEDESQLEQAAPYLVMYTQQNMGYRLDLTETKKTLGRSPDADIVVNDQRVSKIHCAIQYLDGAIVIEDNNSTNGTFVNGERIERATVESSALLQIGSTVMKIEFKNKTEVDYEDELLRKATTDQLTGVANRHYFTNRAKEELAFAKRYNNLVGLAMLDIDHFKQVNDTHGHQAGDFVLSQFASIVKKRIRGEDIMGRFGGEEFVILMRGEIEAPGAKNFCDRIRVTVEEFDFVFNEEKIPVTVSIGLALKRGLDVESLNQMVELADKALYTAKRKGRNRVEIV